MDALRSRSPVETPAAGQDLPALVASLQEEVRQLRRDVSIFRTEAGYWKSRHADALQRNEQLQAELDQARAEVRQLQQRLFGRKAERRLAGQDIAAMVDEDLQQPARKRGGQAGHAGHRRESYAHLPAQEEFYELPEEARCCPHCGKPRQEMTDTEDSQQLEIEVRAYRRVIRRKRYRATCDCANRPLTVTAPAPPKLIPKGSYGISVWVYLLWDKYSSARPTARVLEQFRQQGITLSAATITEGFERLEALLEPVYAALLAHDAQASFHQADETRWMVYEAQEGKTGHRWWLWVILSPESTVYLIDARRSHDVPENHFPAEASGILVVDRYSAYKAMHQVKLGRLLLAFCWAHVRRDFLEVGRGSRELESWALRWLRCIRDVYHTNTIMAGVTASMGPRRFSRGNPSFARSVPPQELYFNGATAVQPWKSRMPSPSRSWRCGLQWGHGGLAVEIAPRRHKPADGNQASMGPRRFSRGNVVLIGTGGLGARQLQWGHGGLAVEMELVERQVGPGKIRLQWGHGGLAVEIKGSSTFEHETLMLQWGHGGLAVEILQLAPVGRRGVAASMGPRRFSRGNRALLGAPYLPCRWLQWGHGGLAVEMRGRGEKSHDGERGFNGATAV